MPKLDSIHHQVPRYIIITIMPKFKLNLANISADVQASPSLKGSTTKGGALIYQNQQATQLSNSPTLAPTFQQPL